MKKGVKLSLFILILVVILVGEEQVQVGLDLIQSLIRALRERRYTQEQMD
jgi:hypothetical protein